MLKFKLILALFGSTVTKPSLTVEVGATKTVYGPTVTGEYAVLGEGFVPTRDCTVTARGMRAEVADGFITFIDAEGEMEGRCQIGRRPVVKQVRSVVHTQSIEVR